MRILRLCAYYDPEILAATHMTRDLEEAFSTYGFTSINYTPMPTRGISEEVYKQYKGKKYEELNDGHTIVHRFQMFREGKNPIQRALRYLFCNVAEYHLGIREKNIDVVFCSSTPPTQGMLCAMVAKRLSKKYKRKVPFVYNLQDIFPDSLVNTGMTKKGSLLWKIGKKIEDYTYKNADKIIVISDGFKRNIVAKGVPDEKIKVVSNWVDLTSVQPVNKEDNCLYDEFGISKNKFIVLYAGNFGEAQGADIVLKAAELLKNESDIQFVIFGGGACFNDAQKQADTLPNVIINSLLPPEKVSEVYSLGNVALITCKPGTGNAAMPSKTWSIMACDTPIIASFDTDSDLADVLKTSGAGVCVTPGNAEALAETIKVAYNDYLAGKKAVADIRGFAIKNASKDVCVKGYIETMINVCKNKN